MLETKAVTEDELLCLFEVVHLERRAACKGHRAKHQLHIHLWQGDISLLALSLLLLLLLLLLRISLEVCVKQTHPALCGRLLIDLCDRQHHGKKEGERTREGQTRILMF